MFEYLCHQINIIMMKCTSTLARATQACCLPADYFGVSYVTDEVIMYFSFTKAFRNGGLLARYYR
jgi:hypothetical protein